MHNSLEIITPAACMDLTVLATVKQELGIPDSDISQDEKLAGMIKQASGVVSEYCDQIFGEETVTETFWSDAPSEWTRSFMLARSPVTSIVSVVIDDLLLDPSEYRVATDGHLHRVDDLGSFWAWTNTAVITYTAGYLLLDGLPYGIERATLLLIKEFNSSLGRDPRVRSEDIPGVRNVSYWVGGGVAGSMNTLPPDVIALLRPHRRLVFA